MVSCAEFGIRALYEFQKCLITRRHLEAKDQYDRPEREEVLATLFPIRLVGRRHVV